MIIKGKPVRDFSPTLNTFFRGLGCLLLLLLLINLYKITDNLSDSALALQQLKLSDSIEQRSDPAAVPTEAIPTEAVPEVIPQTVPSPSIPPAASIDEEILALRQAALVRFSEKFNYPNSVEFYGLASNENWMFSPATVKEKDNVLNLTTCGYYTAKNAMGLARERVPFIMDLVYDFMNQKYSLSGYFQDDRSHYYQFDGRKKPVELARNRFRNKWELACKPLDIDKYDDILSGASLGRFEPNDATTFKRQLNAFDATVQKEILSCIEDEALSASVPGLAARQNLCLLEAQCSILGEVVGGKCELVNKACADDGKALLCKGKEPIAS